MSNSGNTIKGEGIREIAASSLTTSYQDLGSPIEHRAFIVTIVNNSNCEVYIKKSTDPVADNVNTKRFPAFSGRIVDQKTNDSVQAPGTQFTIKLAGTPPLTPEGDIWLEIDYV